MYSNISGCVKADGSVSQLFNISLGLRQGCNLSPYLFNLYNNHLIKILNKAEVDPVHLNGTKISSLFYADDMLLISNSEADLQRSLDIVEEYESYNGDNEYHDSMWISILNGCKLHSRKYEIYDEIIARFPNNQNVLTSCSALLQFNQGSSIFFA